MHRVLGAYFRKLGRSFNQCFDEIATGIETNDQALKQHGFQELRWLLIPRCVLWAIPGVYYAVKDIDLLGGYIEFIAVFYILAAVLAAAIPIPVDTPTPPPVPVKEPIAAVQARAENRREIMCQAAFVLFGELVKYLPGLPSISLQSVEANPPYIINSNRTIIHYMKVMKGRCDADVDTILRLLETIIGDHIQAKDLPVAVVDVYTSSNGDKAPGLVVDGVYDMGDYYRVGLAITDDAEAAVYVERHTPKVSGVDMTDQAVTDEDFD